MPDASIGYKLQAAWYYTRTHAAVLPVAARIRPDHVSVLALNNNLISARYLELIFGEWKAGYGSSSFVHR
ncbi:MAG: hypothetical protein ACM336_09265 [Acidobacteriota bacterium]